MTSHAYFTYTHNT